TYTPTASGSATISAQVVDSVLYDSTDSSTVNLSPGVAGPTNFNAFTTGNGPGKKSNFSWVSDGDGPYTVYNASTNIAVGGDCQSKNGSSCQVSFLQAPSGSYYVKDNDGNKSNTASL